MEKRTLQQNKALHLHFQHIAEALNDAGQDMRRTLSHEIEIPWTAETVKEYLWRPVQEAQLLKESTTELTTKEINEIAETLARFLGAKVGVVPPPFPNNEEK